MRSPSEAKLVVKVSIYLTPNVFLLQQASKYYLNEYGRGHLFGSNATLSLDFMYMPKTGLYHVSQDESRYSSGV